MVSVKTIVVSGIAATGMVQMCPAPFMIPIITAVGTAIGGAGAICSKLCPQRHRRDELLSNVARALPPGVAQYNMDICSNQIKAQDAAGTKVMLSNVDDTSMYPPPFFCIHTQRLLTHGPAILVDNMPPACMVLATVLTGHATQEGGPIPIPMSNKSLRYINMSIQDRMEVAKALGV